MSAGMVKDLIFAAGVGFFACVAFWAGVFTVYAVRLERDRRRRRTLKPFPQGPLVPSDVGRAFQERGK